MNGALHAHHFSQQHLHHNPNHLYPSSPPAHTLASQPELDLNFDPFGPLDHSQPDLTNPFDSPTHYDAGSQARFHEIRSNAPLNGFQTPQNGQAQHFEVLQRANKQNEFAGTAANAGQFGVLTPNPQVPSQPQSHSQALGSLQNEIDLRTKPVAEGGTTDGHFRNLKMIPDPPNLQTWRQKLFDVNETINMTEDEFQTYFPHVDNIYSHRSTQRYKRKPFVSHYWDCRLKGRPPGTAKSDDPSKKKRKRTARERDQCDVKIKITEHFPDPDVKDTAGVTAIGDNQEITDLLAQNSISNGQQQPPSTNVLPSNDESSSNPGVPARPRQRYYQIQRVNGNGANGKELATSTGHKHTIEDSDKIKKNSVLRYFLKEEKEKRKSQKTYHKRATGAALYTVRKHAKENDLKLYGSCFCPFVQRIWIALELKSLPYQYIEVDPYKKPASLLAINPRGLIPALKHGDWGCYESSVLLEYLEDLNTGLPLLPANDPKARAHCRLWADHANRKVLPHFYGLLQAQETEKQTEHAKELKTELDRLIEAADDNGPFFLGPHPSFVDVVFAPWILRFRRVLKPYRTWPDPEEGTRWHKWVEAIEGLESVKATTSGDDLYVDSYERYAENRPNTSQVADAVNAGGGLP